MDLRLGGDVDGAAATGPEGAPAWLDGFVEEWLATDPVVVDCPPAEDGDGDGNDEGGFVFDDAPDDGLDYGHGIGFGPDDYILYDIDATDDEGAWQAPPEVIRTPVFAAAPLSGAAALAERGGAEDDDMTGGRGGDDLRGRGGDDTVHGRGGADSLLGGGGADSLYGDNGRDRLEGGGGDDLLHGGRGRDRLYGGGGDDTLYSDGGADRMFGGRGADAFNFDIRDGTGDTIFIGDFESGVDRLVCRGYDAPATEADFETRTVRDGLSNTLLFGEVIARFDTAHGEVPTFDDLLFA